MLERHDETGEEGGLLRQRVALWGVHLPVIEQVEIERVAVLRAPARPAQRVVGGVSDLVQTAFHILTHNGLESGVVEVALRSEEGQDA